MGQISHLFVDTSFFYAVMDKRDRDHSVANKMAEFIQERQIPLISTWEVIVETITLLRYRYSYHGATVFIKKVLPSLNIFYIDEEIRTKALHTFLRFSRDKKISLCDATSYVVVAKYMNFIPCLTFDEDFKRMDLVVFDLLN